MTTTPEPDENTGGRAEARRALAASRRSSAQADSLIRDTRVSIERLRGAREENHFADKFRKIIQGAV